MKNQYQHTHKLEAAEQLIRAQRGILAVDTDPRNALEVTLAPVHGAGHFLFLRENLIVAECLVSPAGPNFAAWEFFIAHFGHLLSSRCAFAIVDGVNGPPNEPWTAIIMRAELKPADMGLITPSAMARAQVYVRSGHNGWPGNARN